MSEYTPEIEQKIEKLRAEISEFERLRNNMDEDDPEWDRVTDQQRRLFSRYDLEIELRREVCALERMIRDRLIDEEAARYRLAHTEFAIFALKRMPDYAVPVGQKQELWPGRIVDEYRNEDGGDALWAHVRLRVGLDESGGRWSEIPREDQLRFILARVKTELAKGFPEMHVWWIDERDRVTMMAGRPKDLPKRDAVLRLYEAVDAVEQEMRLFRTVGQLRDALRAL